jgi:hypothetical protein
MRDVVYLLFQLLTNLAKLLQPGGSLAVIAENLILKKQLIIDSRSRHPFVEPLIGSIRRELLDHTFFWTATDLENKLKDYQCYFNEDRTQSGRSGETPVESGGKNVVDINNCRWQKHYRGLFELPMAA